MQPIPTKVKNITLYAYFNPTEPLSETVLTGASGTYSVGTLMTSIFYNLDIENEGSKENPLSVHGKYYATCETEAGDTFTTPWMYCLDNSDKPRFGRTITAGKEGSDDANLTLLNASTSSFIELGSLTDITVSQLFPSPAIGQRILIENGKGCIISTRTGTPHEMGVQIDSGDRTGEFLPGSKNIIISGKTKDGEQFFGRGYTVISNGNPAIFLQVFGG